MTDFTSSLADSISIRDYDMADWKYEKIMEQIHNFEETLDPEHEIALKLASFGSSITMIAPDKSWEFSGKWLKRIKSQ